ncbi:MAG: hypothetical protein K9K93_03315 [Acholeplasmataceae bacterium]|nr:hypothetical protein [Acholeplasmataceae bacterium]
MAKKTISMFVDYIEYPKPTLRIAFVEKTKGVVSVVFQEQLVLESYQIESWIIKDEKVIAEHISKMMSKLDYKISNGISVSISSPRVLNYSVIMPRMNAKKASQMAFKELEETFIKYEDLYSIHTKVFDNKEKGVFVNFYMLPKDLIGSFVNLSEHMDKYIDSVNLGSYALVALYRSLNLDAHNLVMVYGNEVVTMLGLIINGQMVECDTVFSPISSDQTLMSDLVLRLKIIMGKHEFAYERVSVKDLIVLCDDGELKESIKEFILNETNLTPLSLGENTTKTFFEVFLQNDDYLDYSFKIDV